MTTSRKQTFNPKAISKCFGDLSVSELHEIRKIATKKIREKTHVRLSPPPDATRKDFTSLKFAYSYVMNDCWDELYPATGDDDLSYYVYAHIDPSAPDRKLLYKQDSVRDVELIYPIYIGMGKGNRVYNFNRCVQHTKKLSDLTAKGFHKDEICQILFSGLSEWLAKEVEAKLILFWGCKLSHNRKLKALSGSYPCLYNNRYEPYPDRYDTLNMCHSKI